MRGGSGGTEGRRRGDHPGKNFLVGGLQPSHLTPNLFLSGGEPLNGLSQPVEALRHLLRLLRVEGGGGWRRRDRPWRGLRNMCRFLGLLHRRPSSSVCGPASGFVQLAIVCLTAGDQPSSGALVAIIRLASSP